MDKNNYLSLFDKTAHWMLPPGIKNKITDIWRTLARKRSISAEMRREFERNARFKDIHKGERCFILATGPSINKENLKLLKDETCFAVSMFYLHKDIHLIDPLYHVDAAMHAPFGFDFLDENFKAFENYYSDKTTFFFGHTNYEYSYYNYLTTNSHLRKDNTFFLNYVLSTVLDEWNHMNQNLWDITKSLFSAQSVVYCAIQIAAYMGFKDIYLLGCDYDHIANSRRKRSTHFYGDTKGLDDSGSWPSMEEILFRYLLMWKQYRLMKSYLSSRGITVYNATEGSYLDIFQTVSLEKILAERIPK